LSPISGDLVEKLEFGTARDRQNAGADPVIPMIYFGGFAGEGDAVVGEAAERGAATGGFSNEAGLGPAGEVAGFGPAGGAAAVGDGFFSAMSEARSFNIWSTVDFAIR
jgi:hypothetical protein